MFQFHFGSIGSCNLHQPRKLVNHVSIPLWFDWKLPRRSDVTSAFPCFNSTLVRLEEWAQEWKRSMEIVSIPLWFDWKTFSVIINWIWSFVSIPLWFDWKIGIYDEKPRATLSFNSTLVRLEASELPVDIALDLLFQFHFGSIGRLLNTTELLPYSEVSIPLWFDWKCWLAYLSCFLTGFNSSMVRLEASSMYWCLIMWSMFQFQYGSIGSFDLLIIKFWKWKFQFQYGSIGSLCRYLPYTCPLAVSIPVWFDWKNSSRLRLRSPFSVSIPVWFDWK